MNRLFEITGEPYELGFQQGRHFKEELPLLFKALTRAPVLPPSIQKWIPGFVFSTALRHYGRKFFKLHASVLQNFYGEDLTQKVRGLADGFEAGLPLIYGLNAFEIISSQLPYSLGCTTLAFDSSQMADHVPRLVYNHDFPEVFGPHIVIRKTRPARGYASLALTYPIALGAMAGVNERGLCFSVNHAYATDLHHSPAIPITLLLQTCLQHCSTVDEALKMIDETPVPNGSIATFVDRSGARATVELACTRKQVRRGEKGKILCSFNKYEVNQMQEIEIPLHAKGKGILKGYGIHDHNVSRKEHFTRAARHETRHSEEDIRALVSDHNGGEGNSGTICRHDAATTSTLCSLIMNPAKASLKIIFGNPCKGTYKEYNL